ncbi:MAG: hypothetical protein LC122_08755 [Chitinophagales bacterium]|nr:hypothetical protein [Chitinophagales bacterium]
MIQKFFEYSVGKFEPIKSFYLNDKLNNIIFPDVDDRINQNIKKKLLEIANDYFNGLEIEVKLQDIILTGSLVNYNYSKYLILIYLLFDFSDVNDDKVLVKKFLDASNKIWNLNHDITIEGYEVEIYCQDVDESHRSSGQYSLVEDKWLVKPSKENFVPDEDLIKRKAEQIMSSIEDLENDLEETKAMN